MAPAYRPKQLFFECFEFPFRLLCREAYLGRIAKAFEGTTPHRFRPTYPGANVVHVQFRLFFRKLAPVIRYAPSCLMGTERQKSRRDSISTRSSHAVTEARALSVRNRMKFANATR